ncbi:hypothetical protein KUTeg_012061 [Tegillarca granosa]|uniref:Uncharacterized protein n=1 Tax=Tegillarca granosa TaxID=220873 RepID=A0ABQ9F1X0_TEGGR|nr:hypothetical protein KUTeg_012061 [Tegillarca granosa]
MRYLTTKTYKHMMIVVAYEREEIGVFVDNRDRLKCKDSIDIVRGPDSLLFNSKEKTCSVTGVLYLQKGQIVTFNIITAKTTILMEKKSTYIGVVHCVRYIFPSSIIVI